MPRLRLLDCRLSRLPEVAGLCQTDIPGIAEFVNSAQQRLLYAKEASDESWHGTWAEVRLNVSRDAPYITLPREIARLELADVCDKPVPIFNQFYEYLRFGNGRMSKNWVKNCRHPIRAAYERNNAVLFTDLTNAPQIIAVYALDVADTKGDSRVLIQGLDSAGNVVYSQDGQNQVQGVYVTLAAPFASTSIQFSQITGVQKDVTQGAVQIMQMDPNTGDQVLLLQMEPGEEVAGYRRYFFNNLPCGCCPQAGVNVTSCPTTQVTAMAKLELLPVAVDTDYLLFQNIEALIEEVKAIRYSDTDTVKGRQLEQIAHTNAIRLLNGELGHYHGVNSPVVNFAPFGSARLEKRRIGTLI